MQDLQDRINHLEAARDRTQQRTRRAVIAAMILAASTLAVIGVGQARLWAEQPRNCPHVTATATGA